MDNNKFQIEVLERLTAIETTLKQIDYKAIADKVNESDKKVIELEAKVQNNTEKISKIEDNGKWLWRTVGASIIIALLGLIFKT